MKFFLVLLLSQVFYLQSQIKGTVVINKNNTPLANVFIKNIKTSQWTVSDNQGNFVLAINKFPVTLKFHLLGKVEVEKTFNKSEKNVIIYLEDDNLTIDEIVVTAKTKKNSTASNIILGKQALNLVQAQSIADVMQLIPGNSISESDLHDRQLLNIRSAYFTNDTRNNTTKGLLNSNNEYLLNNSFGVGYLIDGVPLNNNVNLSGFKGISNGVFSNVNENSSVNMGVDLKNLSLSNIESIEVVQGVSSAKYGDHTSGLVKINKVHGREPFKINTTLRGGSYSFNLTKGYRLSKKMGFLNMGLDYLKADNDPRYSILDYNRLNINSDWSYRKKGKVKNLLNISYWQNFNGTNAELTQISERSKKSDYKRFRVSNSNTLYFDDNFLNKLTSTFSIDYGINEVVQSYLTSSGGKVILNGLKEETYIANYTPVSYRAIEAIENKPFSFFSRIEITKKKEIKNTSIKLSLGTTLGIDKNFGKGNITKSDSQLIYYSQGITGKGKQGFRNVNFNDFVPTDIKFSTYLTTKINSFAWNKKWITSLGIRYDNYNKKGTLSPRFNTALHFSEKIKIRAGFGFFTKSPSLQAQYSGKTYYDFLLKDYRTSTYSFALAHTLVREYENSNLKASNTLKYETGFDYNSKKGSFSFTSYYNKLSNGFTNISNYEIAKLPEYNYTFYPDKIPKYLLKGYKSVLLNYRRTGNDLTSENYGAELLLNTKKIKSINTSFNFSASYRVTKNIRDNSIFTTNNDITSDFLIGLHKNIPVKYEKIKSSITTIHHISSIGLVLTLTAEQFLMAKKSTYGRVIYPYAYYDKNFIYHKIPEKERTDEKYKTIRYGVNSSSATDNLPKMFGNYHLKLSKEFDNGLRFSFYAINFLNIRPKAVIRNTDGSEKTIKLNRPISFGGSIFYKF